MLKYHNVSIATEMSFVVFEVLRRINLVKASSYLLHDKISMCKKAIRIICNNACDRMTVYSYSDTLVSICKSNRRSNPEPHRRTNEMNRCNLEI